MDGPLVIFECVCILINDIHRKPIVSDYLYLVLLKIIVKSFWPMLHTIVLELSFEAQSCYYEAAKYFWNRGSTLLSCLTILGSNLRKRRKNLSEIFVFSVTDIKGRNIYYEKVSTI